MASSDGELLGVQPSQEGWLSRILGVYAEGGADINVCAKLRCTMATFQKWYKENDAFRQTVDIGRTLSKAYWFDLGRQNISNKNFVASVYNFQMKNRYGWSEKNSDPDEIEDEDMDLDKATSKAFAIIDNLRKKTGEQGFSAEEMKKVMGLDK